jgi:excisionase family DNA binding protein
MNGRATPTALLTVAETAAILRVSETTIRRLIKEGALKAQRVGPHERIRIERAEVDRYPNISLSRSVAMQLTGHKTEAVYRRYAITSEADLREGGDRLNGARESRTTSSAKESA